MQISAINLSRANSAFLGRKQGNTKPAAPKKMSNEEVLKLQAERMQKRKPHFTPKQKEILPIAQDFVENGSLDELQENLKEAQDISAVYKQTGNEQIESDGKYFTIKKQTGEDVSDVPNSSKIIVTAYDDTTDEELYTYSERTIGGYTKYAVKTVLADGAKAEIFKQGQFSEPEFSVRNSVKKYVFSGKINDEGKAVVDFIKNPN